MIIALWSMISLCSLLILLNLKIIEFENLKMKYAFSNFRAVNYFQIHQFSNLPVGRQVFKLNLCLKRY